MNYLVIKQCISDLEVRLKKEKIPNRRVRLEALLLKRVNPEASNIELAQILNVNRVTVARWLKEYKEKGLRQYLKVNRTASRARMLLSDEQKQILYNAIENGNIKTYRQAQKMILDKFALTLDYKRVHAFICYQMKIKLVEEKNSLSTIGTATIPWAVFG